MVNVLVLILCIILVFAQKSPGRNMTTMARNMTTMALILLSISVLYLAAWFLLAVRFMPSRAVEMLRDIALASKATGTGKGEPG